MAVKGLTALTLADWGKRVDPNGKVDKIIELLSQTNPILQDMPFVEGNLPTGHQPPFVLVCLPLPGVC